MTKSLYERTTGTEEGMKLYCQELAILEVTEKICEMMSNQGVTKSDLAKKLDLTKGYITQVLDGRNLTLKTIATLFWALDARVTINYRPLDLAPDSPLQSQHVTKFIKGFNDKKASVISEDFRSFAHSKITTEYAETDSSPQEKIEHDEKLRLVG
ncbi:MAG: hypothetical protein ABIK28_21790 [Planctomycetota bacterium]